MRVPSGTAAVPCLCALVVLLCVICKSCCGIRVNLNPQTYPNTSLYPSLEQESLPEPTLVPNSNFKEHVFPLKLSQLFQDRPQKKPWDLASDFGSNTNSPSETLQTTSDSDIRLKQQNASKQNHLSYQDLPRIRLNNQKKSLEFDPRINPKPGTTSFPNPQPEAYPDPEFFSGLNTQSGLVPGTKLPVQLSRSLRSNFSGSAGSDTASNQAPNSQSSPKSPSKARFSQTNTNRITNSPPKTKRNDTKDSRPKRGWIWNQFFVLEEHIGPEPQYVGKVKYPYFLIFELSFPLTRFVCV